MSLLTQTEVYDQIIRAESGPQRLAIATIVTTSGSTPQRTGAKLLVFEDGRMLGTVGGGCVEADVWAEAREALLDGQSRLCHFTLRDNPDVPPDEEGMICGGEMEVLIEVWGLPHSLAPLEVAPLGATAMAQILHQALAAGRPACLVAVLPPQGARPEPLPAPRRLLVEATDPLRGENAGETPTGTLGDPQLDLLAVEQARHFMADDRLEITVAGPPQLALPDGTRLLFEISRP
ncbi:MAG: XdhC family protein, partial [Acidobacteriota bacterium]